MTWFWEQFRNFPQRLLLETLQARVDVFVVEQQCAYPEIDQDDWEAHHLLGWMQAPQETTQSQDTRPPDAYLRVLAPLHDRPEVHIGRVLVKKDCRGRGVARALMEEGLRKCQDTHPGRQIVLSAQSYLVDFYETLGFRVDGPEYHDVGIPHVPMALQNTPSSELSQ